MILTPFIEATPIWSLADKSLAWDSPQNAPNTMFPFKYFACPGASNAKTTIHTSYLGIAGVGPDAATLPADDPRIGAFGYDRTLKFEDITDGTSNTMLLLETLRGGPWAQGGPSTVRGLDPNDRPHHSVGRTFDADHRESRWFSRTTSTVTMTMCDGSIRTLRDSVSPQVLEALATVRGKEEVPEDW